MYNLNESTRTSIYSPHTTEADTLTDTKVIHTLVMGFATRAPCSSQNATTALESPTLATSKSVVFFA